MASSRRVAWRQGRRFRVAIAVLVLLLGGGVAYALVTHPAGSSSGDVPRRTSAPTSSRAPTTTPSTTQTSAANLVDKVMVIVLENHSSAQIRTEAPRLTALADQYGAARNAVAPCGHPSLPNYVCLSAGGRYLTSDRVKTLTVPDIWNDALSAGRTMRVYADGLPAAVRDRFNNVGTYVPRHVFTVPFVSTPAKRANFSRFTVNARTLAADVARGALPNVGALIPDQCHNAHDECPGAAPTQIKQADNWIADQVQVLQSGPDWKSGHLLIVVTADEDDSKGVNDIPMIAIHPSLSHYSTDVPVNLYSVGGLLADVGHTARLGEQASAPDFAESFRLVIADH